MGSSPSSFKVPESKRNCLQSTGGIPCGLVVRTPGTQEAGRRFDSPMDPHWQSVPGRYTNVQRCERLSNVSLQPKKKKPWNRS